MICFLNFLNAIVIWDSTVLIEIFSISEISWFVKPSFLLKRKISLHFFGSFSMHLLICVYRNHYRYHPQ